MMKAGSLVALLAAGCAALVRAVAADDTPNTFGPPRFSYQRLEHLLHADDDKEVPQQWRDYFQSVLETVGLFCITDIPGMGHFKPQTLEHLDACIQEEQQEEDSVVASHVFADGTLRQTLATTPGTPLLLGPRKEKDFTSPSSSACVELEQNSGPFRGTVAEVTRTVAELLRVLSGLEDDKALLVNAQGGKYNLQNMVNEGEHLEHFHVYQKSGQNNDTTSTTTTTLDWHTDQGLMLFFSPGIRYGEPTQYDFFIQLPESNEHLAVEFSPRDELVVMLGEGIQQYVNPHLPPNHQWRAVPHRLTVQETPRIWYGRMVLPPPLALHPHHPQRTFGELRRNQIVHPQQYESFGCGTDAIATTTERILQTEESCQPESQQYCWHRCMNFTATVSPSACEATNNQTVACTNAQRQLWTGDHNPDFSLACLDAAEANDGHGDGGHEDGNKTEPHSEEGGSHSDEGHDDGPMAPNENGDTPSAAGVPMCVGVAVIGYSILGALLLLV